LILPHHSVRKKTGKSGKSLTENFGTTGSANLFL
jgi:hypothetical protein